MHIKGGKRERERKEVCAVSANVKRRGRNFKMPYTRVPREDIRSTVKFSRIKKRNAHYVRYETAEICRYKWPDGAARPREINLDINPRNLHNFYSLYADVNGLRARRL